MSRSSVIGRMNELFVYTEKRYLLINMTLSSSDVVKEFFQNYTRWNATVSSITTKVLVDS